MLSQSHASYLFLIAGALIGIGYGSVTPILQTQTIGSVERLQYLVLTLNKETLVIQAELSGEIVGK